MDKIKKINLIEPPLEEEVSREELEEALGGWNCGSYDPVTCVGYDSGPCTNNEEAKDYCASYSKRT